MAKSEIDFILSEAVDYTTKEGTLDSALQIALKAPTKAQNKLRYKLKQGLTNAMFELSKAAKASETASDSAGEIDGEAVITLLYASNLDLEAFNKLFEQLLISGSGSIGGMPLTQNIIDRINVDDSDRMLGEYLASFLALSSPSTPKAK